MGALFYSAANGSFSLDPGLSLQSFFVPPLKSNVAISTHEIHPSVSSMFRKLTVIEFGKRDNCQRSMLNIYPSGDRLVMVYADRRIWATHADVRNEVIDMMRSGAINFEINRDALVSGVLNGNDRGENDALIVLDFPVALTGDPAENRKIYSVLSEYYKNLLSVVDSFVKPSGGKTYFNATQKESIDLLKFMGELHRDEPRLNYSVSKGEVELRKAIQDHAKAGKFYYSPPTHSRYISVQQFAEALDLGPTKPNTPRLVEDQRAFMERISALRDLLMAESISNGAPEMLFLLIDDKLQFIDGERQGELLSEFLVKYDYTAAINSNYRNPNEWHRQKESILDNWREFLSYFNYSTHEIFRFDDLTNPVQVQTLVTLIRGEMSDNRMNEWVEGLSTPLAADKLGYFRFHEDGRKEWIDTSDDKTAIAMGQLAREMADDDIDMMVLYRPKSGILTRETRNPLVSRELGAPADTSVVIETAGFDTRVLRQLTVFKLDPTSEERFDRLKKKNSRYRESFEWEVIRSITSLALSDEAHAKRLTQFNLFQQLLDRLGHGLEVEPFQRVIKVGEDGVKRSILHRPWMPGELLSRIEYSSRDYNVISGFISAVSELYAVNHFALKNVFGRDEMIVTEENPNYPVKVLHFGANDSFLNILNYKTLSEHENVSAILSGATISFMIASYVYGHYGFGQDKDGRDEAIKDLIFISEQYFRRAADKITRGGPLNLEFMQKAYSGLEGTLAKLPQRFSIESGIRLAEEALSQPYERVAALKSAAIYRMMPLYHSVLGDISLTIYENTPEGTHEHTHKVEMVNRLASEVEGIIKTHAADPDKLDNVFTFLEGTVINFSRLSLDLRESLISTANTISSFKYDEDFELNKMLALVRSTKSDEEFSREVKRVFPDLEFDRDMAQKFHKSYNAVVKAKELEANPDDNQISRALDFIISGM